MRDFFEKPLTYTIFNSEVLEALPLKPGVSLVFLRLPLLFIISPEVPIKVVRKRKKKMK